MCRVSNHDKNAWEGTEFEQFGPALEAAMVLSVVGEGALADDDRRYLAFSAAFERDFVGQGGQRRTITETLDLAWDLLAPFPAEELTRIGPEHLAAHRRT